MTDKQYKNLRRAGIQVNRPGDRLAIGGSVKKGRKKRPRDYSTHVAVLCALIALSAEGIVNAIFDHFLR